MLQNVQKVVCSSSDSGLNSLNISHLLEDNQASPHTLNEFLHLNLILSRVRNWALKFGVDLWEFGRQVTMVNEIKNVSKLWSTESKEKLNRWSCFCV